MKTFLGFCLLLALLWMPSQANAYSGTILFAGGEDSDFTIVGGGATVTTGLIYGSGFSRESLNCYPNAGCYMSSTLNSGYILSPQFTASTTLWIHANLFGSQESALVTDILRVLDGSGLPRLALRSAQTGVSGGGGLYKVSTINSSNTYTDLVTMSGTCNFLAAWHKLDFYINYGTSGEVTVYCDGIQEADYTGNVTTNGVTQLSQIALGSDGGYNYSSSYWSEIIVSTGDTRKLRLVTAAPSSNGNTHTFDTGAASNVNETTLNTATVDASGTSGEIQEYTWSNSLPSGSWTVVDFRVAALAQVDTTGPQHLQAMVRTQSTDYTSSNLVPPQGSWGYISNDWLTNPNTGVAWTTSDLTATGFNLGFKSAN
jgi:hypothetical protein